MVFQFGIIFHVLFTHLILQLNESLSTGFSQVTTILWSLEVITAIKKNGIATFFNFMH